MKISLLSTSLLCTLFSIGSTIPALAAPASDASIPTKSRIPTEVSAEMAPGAITLQLVRLPFGAAGAPMLLHAWTIKRRAYQEGRDGYNRMIICLDLFSGSEKKWTLALSTCHMTRQIGMRDADSLTYEARWLHPATKEGVVIIEREGIASGSGGIQGTLLRLITLPDGVNSDYLRVQEFAGNSGLTGGGSHSLTRFALDAGGTMTIEKEFISHANEPTTLVTYGWIDDLWTQVSSKQIPR